MGDGQVEAVPELRFNVTVRPNGTPWPDVQHGTWTVRPATVSFRARLGEDGVLTLDGYPDCTGRRVKKDRTLGASTGFSVYRDSGWVMPIIDQGMRKVMTLHLPTATSYRLG